jgi:putative flippase GtrA
MYKSALIAQFFRFGTVGTSGFLIDTAIVYGLKAKLGLYGAGMVSYLVAASWCWALNRGWTFRGRGSGLAHHQWARYLSLNLLGLVLNRGTYAALVAGVPICAAQPVFAVAGGAIAGMMVNFTLSRQLVFR